MASYNILTFLCTSFAIWWIVNFLIMNKIALVAASASSSLDMEAKALVKSGWWNGSSNKNTSECCSWYGITCNSVGSVTQIDLSPVVGNYNEPWLASKSDIRDLNFSSLPNLVYLTLNGQDLLGTIPVQICTLPNLKRLDLSSNSLSGKLPYCLGNLTKLLDLNLNENNLQGSIAFSFGQLRILEILALGNNSLSGVIPSSFGKLKNLIYLGLINNKLSNAIPSTIGELTRLVELDLSFNKLNGTIPSSIFQLTNLQLLILWYNDLSGVVPSTIGQLTSLIGLWLYNNKLNGAIPSSIGQLTNLQLLSLGDNDFSGLIPFSFSQLRNLIQLDLSNINLNGTIPSLFLQLNTLENLYLEENQLSGFIPLSIVNLTNLTQLDLSNNKLTGPIPSNIGHLSKIEYLNLAYNRINGSIPISVATMYNLSFLNLSHNFITGDVPSALENFDHPPWHLQVGSLDLSYNNLSGPISRAFKKMNDSTVDISGNPLIDESPNKTNPLSKTAPRKSSSDLFLKVFLPIVSFCVLVLIIFIYHYCGVKKVITVTVPENNGDTVPEKNGDIYSIWNFDGKMAYDDLIAATEDFDLRYCIGTGGYGSVYRAQLPSGKVVALKKLHRFEAEEPAFDKSFRNEVKILAELRHRNIVKLYGFCLHNRCMFLIYEYMERGSLFYVLRNEVDAMELNWKKRVDVVKAIAYALSYLHHDRDPPIVHRDVSSSNILLNSELEAFVSDFGTARLLDPSSSTTTKKPFNHTPKTSC